MTRSKRCRVYLHIPARTEPVPKTEVDGDHSPAQSEPLPLSFACADRSSDLLRSRTDRVHPRRPQPYVVHTVFMRYRQLNRGFCHLSIRKVPKMGGPTIPRIVRLEEAGIISPAERESLLCSLALLAGQGNVASSGLRLKGKTIGLRKYC